MLWANKVLLLLCVYLGSSTSNIAFVYFQCIELTEQISGVDKLVICLCLCWYTEDDVDVAAKISQNFRRTNIYAGE